MNSISAFAPRLALVMALLMAPIGVAHADAIDLSLNLFYNDDTDPASGGTWQVAAKADQFGIGNVFFHLQNITISGAPVLRGPSGTVNGGDRAGFQLTRSPDLGGYYTFAVIQPKLGHSEESAFYGVGSIMDPDGATPNYTNQSIDFPNATAIGPELTTLANGSNLLWGDGDPLGDTDWDHAAILVSGTFAPGLSPSFFATPTVIPEGDVFIELPADVNSVGTRSDRFEATTVVRSNLTTPTADFGDYNEDGIVNLADYTVWRNTLGATVTAGSGADGDQSGVVDAGDYDVWKNNFGLAATPIVVGSVSTAPVPEPQSLVLLTLTAITAHFFRSSRSTGREKKNRLCEILPKKL
ncbi:hypothetical protein [Aeoliella sp.]|uniref:hypothetical protein n=1 Tax=Aeoliella sp. TaxID=2795800 RepID=UPI003CCC05E2